MAFVKALAKADLPENSGKCVTIEGKKIAIFNACGKFIAIDDTCTHDEASLAEGTVLTDDGKCVVECPWHGAHFDLFSGAAVTLPAVEPVKVYPVRINGDAIELDVGV